MRRNDNDFPCPLFTSSNSRSLAAAATYAHRPANCGACASKSAAACGVLPLRVRYFSGCFFEGVNRPWATIDPAHLARGLKHASETGNIPRG